MLPVRPVLVPTRCRRRPRIVPRALWGSPATGVPNARRLRRRIVLQAIAVSWAGSANSPSARPTRSATRDPVAKRWTPAKSSASTIGQGGAGKRDSPSRAPICWRSRPVRRRPVPRNELGFRSAFADRTAPVRPQVSAAPLRCAFPWGRRPMPRPMRHPARPQERRIARAVAAKGVLFHPSPRWPVPRA